MDLRQPKPGSPRDSGDTENPDRRAMLITVLKATAGAAGATAMAGAAHRKAGFDFVLPYL
ncbi:hypothetical protein ACIG3E_23955 [Streptomyces sp. NPDC053474]|uniref:hypothetical protein n=1 Tax=Streptomyces sp. NPDC053474 TaxID=3365704 RepID=UPI0037D66A23